MKLPLCVRAYYCAGFLPLMVTTASKGSSSTSITLHKPTRQSDTHSGAAAYRAVDGSRSNEYYHGTCTHTDQSKTKTAWWEVDLQNHYHIGIISILNRNAYAHRFHDFRIDVYENEDDPRVGKHCITYQGVVKPGWLHVSCERPVKGRFLRITKPKNNRYDVLTLCEVEISSKQGFVCMALSHLHCGAICGMIDGCLGYSLKAMEDGRIQCNSILEYTEEGIMEGTCYTISSHPGCKGIQYVRLEKTGNV